MDRTSSDLFVSPCVGYTESAHCSSSTARLSRHVKQTGIHGGVGGARQRILTTFYSTVADVKTGR
jgi:hypothetical protein